MADKTIIEQALDYAQLGYNVFPTRKGDKTPATKNGLNDASSNPIQIKSWGMMWSKNGCGIAIRTGQVSNLVVLDVDNKNGVDGNASLVRLLAMVGEFTIPQTFTVGTPSGGCHYYFKAPSSPLRNKVGFAPGLDLRAEGGYVVAPPTPGYVVLHDEQVADLPSWLFKILFVPEGSAKRLQQVAGATGQDAVVTAGGRNNYLTQAAGRLQRNGLLTLEALESINVRDCTPSLPSSEVELIFNSIARYTPEDPIVVVEGIPPQVSTPLVVNAGELGGAMSEYLRDKARVRGQPTGIAGLDKMLGGGLRESELVVLSATAKTGKSTLLIQIIYNLLEMKVPVGFASAEMEPASEILPSLLSIHFGENAWLSDYTEEREAKYIAKLEEWSDRMFFLNRYGSTPIKDISDWMKQLKDRGVTYFVGDHAHFMCENSEDFKVLAEYARGLKKLTMDLKISLILVIQPGQPINGMPISRHSLRGGSSLGQVLNSLLLMERYQGPDGRTVPNVTTLKLDMSRNKLARPGQIFLQYDSETTRLTEAEAVEEPAPIPHLEQMNVTPFPRKY